MKASSVWHGPGDTDAWPQLARVGPLRHAPHSTRLSHPMCSPQIDISGFTKLSEVYSKQGTEGCEEFSLVISDVLARMCDIVERHDGDIDCFAGDAVLVVFEANTESSLSISTGREDSMLDPDSQQSTTSNASPKAVDASQSPATDEPLRRAVDSALRCVFSVASSLNGYETSQDMPPLSLHAALGAGKIFTAECGKLRSPQRRVDARSLLSWRFFRDFRPRKGCPACWDD